MAIQDKVLLLNRTEEILKTRMFANLLEEAMTAIQITLDEFDVIHVKCTSENGTEMCDDCLEAYLNAKRVEGRSEKTLTLYAYTITRFMLWANIRTREVTTAHVRAYLESEQERGLADMTVKGNREVLHAYFGWLEHERLITVNPVFNIAPIKCEEKVQTIFSRSDIERMKRCCKNPRDVAIVSFLLSTTCRISEMCALNRDDIDWEHGEVIVDGKGSKERTVFLDEIALMTLKEYIAGRFDKLEPLFLGYRLNRLTPGGVRAVLKRIEERCGVEDIHPHKFRHTTITNLLDRGMPIQEVALLAGHSKIDTTMKYYTSSKLKIKNSFMKYTA